MTRKQVKFDINPLLSGPSLDTRNRFGSPFRFLPITDIDVDPDQPRRVFNQEALEELAASIKEYGLLNPILVRAVPGGAFRLVAGERRFRACKLLGMETVPAMVDPGEGEADETLAKQLVENLQRQDLNPIERATALGQLRDRYALSVREIASRLGISKSLVQRSLEVLTLPTDLQAALEKGASETKVLMIAQITDSSLRKDLLSKLEGLTRAEIEELIRNHDSNRETKELSHGGTVKGELLKPSTKDGRIVDEIQKSLGTKVRLVRNTKKPGQGRLLIEFYSDEELKDIHMRLTS